MGGKAVKVYSAALAYGTIVGFSFLGTKTCVTLTTPLLTLVWRYNAAFAMAVLLIIFGVVKLDFRGKNLRNLILTALFYIGFMGIQALGLTLATSIESGIVFAVIPIFAQIIAFFLMGERTTWLQNMFVVMSVAGVIIMYIWGSAGLGEINPLGFFILLLSSISMAVCNVMMRYVRKEFRPMEVSCCIAALGCGLFNLTALFAALTGSGGAAEGMGGLEWYLSPLTADSAWQFIIAILYLGIPCLLFTSALLTYTLVYLPAVQGTIFGNLSVVFAIFAGMLLLNEPFYAYHLVCTVMIVAGVLGTSLAAKKPD